MARARVSQFTTIRTEGGLLPADLLARVAADDHTVPGVTADAYHLVRGERLNERITRSWNRLVGAWKMFAPALAALPAGDHATTLTRERWLLPLFEELGYGRLQTAKAIEIDGRSFPISHAWGTVPLHLVGARIDLDRRTPGVRGAAGASPHGLTQELLNRTDAHLWAMVSNGLRLRLLRDNASLTRQAFVEFDVETMFADEVFDDFVVLWLTCHQSRVEGDDPAQCWLERWTAEAAESGTRARDALRVGVERAINELGTGYVAHPANTELKEHLRNGELSKFDYYRQLLRVVYRLLFLFVAEDRNLLHADGTSGDARQRYARFYSLARVRTLARRRRGGPHPDQWRSLTVVFDALGQTDGLPALGLPGLGSFLWSPAACPDLDRAELANTHLLAAVRHLAFFEDRDERVLRPVDYRNLGTEELGAVYEGLLEQHPDVNVDAGTFELGTAAGNERKTTGSYYTPTSLITCLLDSALDPVLDEAVSQPDPESALLDLNVLDPACGSGHFLIAAGHRIAKRLAAVRTGDDEPPPDAVRRALRDVVSHCLHGIDLNPMAVELCKVSLWMEAMEPGKPLSFLDHRIVRGNALLGATPELLDDGVPEAAFKPLTSDDKAWVTTLKKRNKAERAGQHSLFSADLTGLAESFATAASSVDDLSDDTLGAVAAKGEQWADLIHSDTYRDAVFAADTWCTSFVAAKTVNHPAITEATYRRAIIHADAIDAATNALVTDTKHRYEFLHWHLAFPDVFDPRRRGGGFDTILGNPPFLNQLERATSIDAGARKILECRLGPVVRAYTDLSALFLAAAIDGVREGGRVALVQPQSLLAARDASAVRKTLLAKASLQSLWVADTHMFEASVFVCIPTLQRGGPRAREVERRRGPEFVALAPVVVDMHHLASALSWSSLMEGKGRSGATRSGGRLGELASATADFRDQFYGLIPFVEEAMIPADTDGPEYPKLMTTGLVDPARSLWGEVETRFGKKPWAAPRVDLRRLQDESKLGPWALSRLVPKVLVATQTKVLEAYADEHGEYLPSVPLITVIPHRAADLWRVLSVVLSPTASRWAYTTFRGVALSADAVKLSASQVREIPLPHDLTKWSEAAEVVQEAQRADDDQARRSLLDEMAQLMCAAYDDDDETLKWWSSRLPAKRKPQRDAFH